MQKRTNLYDDTLELYQERCNQKDQYKEILDQYRYVYSSNDEMIDYIVNKADQLLKSQKLSGEISPKTRSIDLNDLFILIINNIPTVNVGISIEDAEIYFYDYDLNKWSDDKIAFKTIVTEIKGLRVQNIDKVYDELLKSIRLNRKTPFVSTKQETNFEIVNNKFDTYVDFNNVRYYLSTGEREEITRSMLSVNNLGYDLPEEVDENFKNEIEEMYLNYANNDENKALTLKQSAICCILGYNPTRKMMMLQGNAGSGKSTILNLNMILAGYDFSMNNDNVVKFSLSDFDRDDALETIGNAKMLYSFDNNDKIRIKNVEVYKTLLSKEVFAYFVKFGSRGHNSFNGFMMQAANVFPSFDDKTSKQAIIDRMILIVMDKRFRNTNNEISNFAKYMTNGERKGQFALYLLETVDGFNDFAYSDNSELEEKMNENDPVYHYVEELKNSYVLYNRYIPANLNYDIYKDYMYTNNTGNKLKAQRNLTNQIKEYFYELGFDYVNRAARLNKLKSGFDYSLLSLNNTIEENDNSYIASKYFEREISQPDKIESLMDIADAYFYLKELVNSHKRLYNLELNKLLDSLLNEDIEQADIDYQGFLCIIENGGSIDE